MFGALARESWAKRVDADSRNRVEIGINPLLILGPEYKVLVDPGIGAREGKRFGKAYDIRLGADPAGALAGTGVHPEEIDLVINTHLHWDHSGANLKSLPDGGLVPAFPNAVYLVQRGEWESACHVSALTREGYLFQDDPTLIRTGQLELLHGESEIVPGIWVVPSPGHTPFHQSVLVESEGKALLYPGDLIPTGAHLPLTTLSALDLDPQLMVETKRRILDRARRNRWTIALCHERERPLMAPGAVR
jgi:glyoxylase-like metal-dependent hydrolase (beta-lactamase superfamily II)